MQIKTNNFTIGKLGKCFIIAEAGSNHNGDVELGKKLITAAKECGCDAVKFQAFKTEELVTEKADKAEYQEGKSSGESQFEMLKALELSQEDHNALVEYGKQVGIPLFYSVFDKESADLVESLGIELLKLGSGELTNTPLIKHIAEKRKPLMISTGMGTDEEIQEAVDVFRNAGGEQLMLMNCSTGYPSKLEDSNLRRIKYIGDKFNVRCGNSDHTAGILVSVAAAALGSCCIEKHFTINKTLPGPDHPMSMNPEEMSKICSAVRNVEESPVTETELKGTLEIVGIKTEAEDIEKMLGTGARELSEDEKKQRIWARKSIVARKDMVEGEKLTESNIAIKRPEEGILPKEFEKVLGKKTKQTILAGTPITWEVIE